jgi:hypothetical protein
VHQRIDLIGHGEITHNRGAQAACKNDVDMGITVNARRPFAAKELAVFGIDLLLKGIGKLELRPGSKLTPSSTQK